jgi:hypothetical protein
MEFKSRIPWFAQFDKSPCGGIFKPVLLFISLKMLTKLGGAGIPFLTEKHKP